MPFRASEMSGHASVENMSILRHPLKLHFVGLAWHFIPGACVEFRLAHLSNYMEAVKSQTLVINVVGGGRSGVSTNLYKDFLVSLD